MPLRTLIGLILCNLIWSANPAMAKVVLADFTPVSTAWLRYASALAAYLAAAAALRALAAARGRRATTLLMRPGTIRESALLFAIGLMVFCFAPLMQFTGLADSRATDNAVIVAMEPLITVFLAWIFLKESLSGLLWLAFAVALLGFGMLTGLAPGNWTASAPSNAHRIGNLLILVALIGEASYSVAGRKLLASRREPAPIFGSSLCVGVILLTVAAIAKDGSAFFHMASRFTWRSSLAVLWLGPLGTALTYFYWIAVLAEAPVAGLALTLFIQPVCGSILGYLVLGERLSPLQSAGAVLIVGAVLAQAMVARSRTEGAVVGARQ